MYIFKSSEMKRFKGGETCSRISGVRLCARTMRIHVVPFCYHAYVCGMYSNLNANMGGGCNDGRNDSFPFK